LKESYRVLNIQKIVKVEILKQEIPVSIHVSNVMLWDSEKCGRKNWLQNGGQKKVRYFKKSGNLVQK
jgi:ribosomal protein L24